MSTAAPLDTTISVITPENIAFDYELAGPFRRLPAYLIDILVRFGLILAIGMLLGLMGLATSIWIPGSFFLAGMLVAYFLISWFYGTVLETYFNGRTVGKWMFGLRVISVDGRPVDGTGAVIRNLLRIADLAPLAALSQFDSDLPAAYVVPTGIVGLVCMVCTRRMQRLGDLAAGTMVVVDERSWRLPVTQVDDPRAAALASFLPADFRASRTMARTLATYVERRAYLTPPRRREVARVLAEPISERIGFRSDVDPDLLMMALYHATFLVDPRQQAASGGPPAGPSPLLRDGNAPREVPVAKLASGPDSSGLESDPAAGLASDAEVAGSDQGPGEAAPIETGSVETGDRP